MRLYWRELLFRKAKKIYIQILALTLPTVSDGCHIAGDAASLHQLPMAQVVKVRDHAHHSAGQPRHFAGQVPNSEESPRVDITVEVLSERRRLLKVDNGATVQRDIGLPRPRRALPSWRLRT